MPPIDDEDALNERESDLGDVVTKLTEGGSTDIWWAPFWTGEDKVP